MLDGDRRDGQDVDTIEPVGERLRAARAEAGMTLEQVSAATRIRVPVLRDLEDDRLGPAGSAVYTRGHIRAIASAVGVDPAPLVRAFDQRVGAAAPSAVVVPHVVPAPRQPSNGLSVPVPAAPERTQPRWLTASLAGLAVRVALLALASVPGGEGEREPEQTLTSPQAVSSELPPQAAQAPAAAAPASLLLEATGRSWLSVRNRGSVRLFEGQVEAGWTRRFEDPVAITVRVGNAAAVRTTCGAAAAQVPADEGVALTLRCTPSGVERP